MTSLEEIKKVEELTEWANTMVCVKKQTSDLHVCMDPKDLNTKKKKGHYQIQAEIALLPNISATCMIKHMK